MVRKGLLSLLPAALHRGGSPQELCEFQPWRALLWGMWISVRGPAGEGIFFFWDLG